MGGETKLNKMSDLMRESLAAAGYDECLNFVLCSKKDISENLNR